MTISKTATDCWKGYALSGASQKHAAFHIAGLKHEQLLLSHGGLLDLPSCALLCATSLVCGGSWFKIGDSLLWVSCSYCSALACPLTVVAIVTQQVTRSARPGLKGGLMQLQQCRVQLTGSLLRYIMNGLARCPMPAPLIHRGSCGTATGVRQHALA